MPGASYMLSYTLTLLQRCRLNCGSRWQRCRRTVKTRREPWAQRSCSSWDSPSRTNHEHGDGLKGLLSKGISNQTSGLTVEVEEETKVCPERSSARRVIPARRTQRTNYRSHERQAAHGVSIVLNRATKHSIHFPGAHWTPP